jgi:DNA-directed RNA polymerase alpha subunit
MNKDLIRGFLLAHDAPEEILQALANGYVEKTTAPAKILPDLIKDWRMPARAIDALAASGVDTKTKLFSLSSSEVLKILNIGRSTLQEIEAYIHPLTLAHPDETVELIYKDNLGFFTTPQYPSDKK